MDSIKEPTGDECDKNALVYQNDGKNGYAFWFPQMGGYAGRAVALMDREWIEFENGASQGGCIDLMVWHDGEFPLLGEEGEKPIVIHICDPVQFVNMGNFLAELNNAGRKHEKI